MQSIVDKIKDSVNIVDIISEYIDLQKKGKNFWGLCPFHEDSNPSMSVSPEKQMYKCFVCGNGGNVINFVSEYEKITFSKAISKLAKKSGIKYDDKNQYVAKYSENQKKLILALKDANDFFMLSLLAPEGKEALEYTKSRNLSSEIIEKFAIGFSSIGVIDYLLKKGHDKATLINASLMTESERPFFNNRLTFALKNRYGDVVGFSSRTISGKGPKYINSIKSQVFNKSALLYNFHLANNSIQKSGEAYINEGFMDVIAMHKAGITNSLAIMGTALTSEHIPLLKKKKVVLMLDSDEAGVNATLKSIYVLLSHNINVSVVLNGEQKDPDEVLNTKGIDGLKGIVGNMVSGFEYSYSIIAKHINPTSPDKIKKFINEISKYLKFCNKIELDFYKNKISKDYGVAVENIYISPNTNKVKQSPNEHAQTSHNPNYEYQLIKSIIKKPMLAKMIIQHPANLSDPMLLGIVKFLVAKALDKKINVILGTKEKILEINEKEKKYAQNEHEFKDIIDNINKKWMKEMQSSITKKLGSSDNIKDKIKYLEQIKKMGRK